MTEGGGANPNVSQAQLKREIDSLSQDLFNIDLQVQQIKQGQQQIATLERAKPGVKLSYKSYKVLYFQQMPYKSYIFKKNQQFLSIVLSISRDL